jgi:hypothetical protein
MKIRRPDRQIKIAVVAADTARVRPYDCESEKPSGRSRALGQVNLNPNPDHWAGFKLGRPPGGRPLEVVLQSRN